MRYRYFNPNPHLKSAGDCVIRMLCKVTNRSWEECYDSLSSKGKRIGEMPSSNMVWMAYLKDLGFKRYIIPNSCPNCYTIKDFCRDNSVGEYVLATGSHVVTVIDGSYYDSWDSGDEVPIFYFSKEMNYL